MSTISHERKDNDMPQTVETEVNERPEYYEVYGSEIASRNRWWVVTVASLLSTFIAIGFAIFVRIQPPTVVRIGPHGDQTVVGPGQSGDAASTLTPGADEFLNQDFVTRFLSNYLNYKPSDVNEHWRIALNMMQKKLRKATYDALTKADSLGEIDRDHVESDFHLRELDRLPGERLAYLAYGVKDVHHLVNGAETTDHFVSEYRIELATDQRSKVTPSGLWIASYSERPIEGERKDQILAAPDAITSQQ